MSAKCPACARVVSPKSKQCPYCHVSFISDKRILPALLLCVLFGVFGFHRFYVGKVGTGLLQLLTGGGFLLWTVIDFIMILVDGFTDKEGRRLEFWT